MIDKVALLHVHHGKILSSRSRGKRLFYFPGGKRDAGESDLDTLRREIREELDATVSRARYFATYSAAADGHPDGVQVQMTCWTASLDAPPTPSSEIEEVVWLDGDESDQVSPVDRLILADVRSKNLLRPHATTRGRAVVFDLDDTLLQTSEVKWAHHRHVAHESYGIDLDDQTLARHWGEPFDQMIGNLYGHSASLEEMTAANRASAHLFPKTAMPGAVDVVNQLLDEGVVVAVVTSTNTQAAVDDLTRCGFPVDRFATVQGADRTAFHKPDPRVFDTITDQLAAFDIHDISYVGDALIDGRAAAEAGIGFVAVTTGLYAADEFPGCRVISQLSDLPGQYS